jgi:glutathione peroxidase
MDSFHDIKISTWDGVNADVLDSIKGKVALIANVTADCGNAPQLGILQDLYEEYKDQGFEVIAIPTNEFCGEDVTYNQYVDGIKTGQEAYEYAKDRYDVTYQFTELVNSNPGTGWYKQLPEGEVPHPVFQWLSDASDTQMFGNFEKYLVDRNGNLVGRYANGTLLNYAKDNGSSTLGSADEELAALKSDIEKALVNETTGWTSANWHKENAPVV